MRFVLLAADYDGTLAYNGRVDKTTVVALERLRSSGRKLLLATGRHLGDLCKVFPHLDVFARVIVENGGLLYTPETRAEKLLCQAPEKRFLSILEQRKVPFSVGRTIVSTWQPHEEEVLKAIRDSGFDLQVIFNKGAVMVLPSGINKGSGVRAALDELSVSPHNVVAIGDAENDHSFLTLAGCSVAVANALPSVKDRVDIVLEGERGQGVVELCERMLADDLAEFEPKLQRDSIALGSQIGADQQPVTVHPGGETILVAGPSGSGKSTLIAGIVEQLLQHGYQFCLIDPEGDYEGLPGVLSFGTTKERPDIANVFDTLEFPRQSAIVNLLAIPIEDRPEFFATQLLHFQDLRRRTARPHWLIIDEAHHLLPSSWSPANPTLSQVLEGTVLITVHPEHVAEAALTPVSVLVAIGKSPINVFRSFAKIVKTEFPNSPNTDLPNGEALVWSRNKGQTPIHVKTAISTRERLRHARQYSEGELSPEQSFHFRGPEAKLNLRAQNLRTFLQMAEGVDDDTWMYHLHNGDYSMWFKSVIKDDQLAEKTAAVEKEADVSPQQSRKQIKEAVESRYTAPA